MQAIQTQVCPVCSRSLASLFIKRLLFVCLIFTSCLLSTYSTANSESSNKTTIDLTAEEKAWLARHPSFKVAAFPLAPYILKKEGKVSGYMTELLQAVAAKVDLTPEFSYHEISKDAFTAVQTGKVEASMGVIKSPERAKHLTFSPETMPLNLAIFARKSSQSISSLELLKGKRIASYHGYTLLALTKKQLPDAELVLANDAVGMLQLVATGKADAAIQELHTGQYMLRNNYINNLEVKGYATFKKLGVAQGHSYVVNKAYPLLKSILDKGYKALSEREKQQLWDEWFGKAKLATMPEIQLTTDEKAWLAENPVIRLGNSVGWPPFGYVKDGQFTGISSDYINHISKLLNVKFEPAMLDSWKVTIDAAQKGEVDVLSSIVSSPQRKSYLTFTRPYLSYPMVIATLNNVPFIADMDSLNHKRIAVTSGSTAHDLLMNNHPDFNLILVKNTREGLFAVEKNEADAFIDNMMTISSVVASEGFTDIKISGETPYSYDIAIAINKNMPLLASAIQKALDNISEEQRNAIQRKWFSVTFEHEHETDYTIFYQILALATLLLAIFLYWNRRLSQEVHQRKHTEEVLRRTYEGLQQSHQRLTESELWQRGIFDSLEEGVLVVGSERVVTDMNPACQNIFGYSREKIVGQLTEMLHVDNEHYVEFGERITAAFEQDKPAHFEFEAKRKNGEVFPSEHTVSLLKDERGAIVGIVSVIRDISARKQTEETVRNIAAGVSAQTGDAFFKTLVVHLAKLFDAECVLIGLLAEQKQDSVDTLALCIHGEVVENLSYELVHTPCKHVVTGGCNVIRAFPRDIQKLFPGDQMLVEIDAQSYIGAPLLDSTGSPIGLIAVIDNKPMENAKQAETILEIFVARAAAEIERMLTEEKLKQHRDHLEELVKLRTHDLEKLNEQLQLEIVEHKQAEDKLRISQKNLQGIFDNMQDAFYRADIEGRIIMLSPSAERLMQYTVEELMGKKLADYYVDPDGRKKFLKALEEEGGSVQGYEAAVRNKNGSHVWISTNAHYYYDDEGNIKGVEGAIRDISERKKAEDEKERLQRELQQAQKMESIGQLTGGIAHEFNNMLASILGFTELSISQFATDPNSKLSQYLHHILHSSERARDLVTKMRVFGRASPSVLQAVDGVSIIKEVTELLQPTLPSSVIFNVNVAAYAPVLQADPLLLHQVITNLVINAHHAIGEHGKIELSLHGVQQLEGVCSSCHQKFSGEFIEISVRDDGQGISGEVLERIFEPFFTTKEVDKGTGMGLSMVDGMLHQCSGHILVESAEGIGSNFRALFQPALTEAHDKAQDVAVLSVSSVENKCIMVVDDEPGVSGFLAELLTSWGAQVLVFNDPLLALKEFKSDSNSIDLVITDQTMPNMTGVKLVQELRSLRSNLPVILCTGYSESIDEDRAKQMGIAAFLNKPVSSDQLMNSISALLDIEK